MDQEGDFFDHEGREGMKCKNPLRDECDLIQQTSKAQLWQAWGLKERLHPCRLHGVGAGGQELLLGALAL